MQTLEAEDQADNTAVGPHQPTANEWPALFHRYGLAELLIERGRFNWNEIFVVLYGHFGDHAEIERRVALWLRGELQKLQKGKDALGASPVRTRGLLSPLQIADVAMAMLDYDYIGDKPPPTPELIKFRHRTVFANSHYSGEKFSLAVAIEGKAALRGETLTVKRLAKLTGLSTGTISIWRRSPRYKELVEFEKLKPFLGPPPNPHHN